MPTNITGDPWSDPYPPALEPGPAGKPILSVPVDGDLLNANSVRQAFGVLASYVAFALEPHARSAAWGEALMRYRNAIGHTRFGVDHLGFPGGRIATWEELWIPSGGSSGHRSSPDRLIADVNDAWKYTANLAADGTATANNVMSSGEVSQFFRYLTIGAGDSSGDWTTVYRQQYVHWISGLAVAYEWEFALQGAAPGDLNYFMGLSTGGAKPRLGEATDYASFRKVVGSTNWQTAVRGADGSEDVDDTGVSALNTNFHRARIEYHSAAQADDATPAVRFYIDGALVSTHHTQLPDGNPATVNALICPHFSILRPTSGSGTGLGLLVGPNRWRSNLYNDDVF